MKICVIYSNEYKEKLVRKSMVKNDFKIKYEGLILMLAALRNMLYINSTSSAISIGIYAIFKTVFKAINLYMN